MLMSENLIFPSCVKFSDWHISAPKFKYQLAIDFNECIIEIRAHKTATHNVNIQSYELNENLATKLKTILEYKAVTSFLSVPECEMQESGYRDGWHTEFVLSYDNAPLIKGELGMIFDESPLEKVLALLKKECPLITELKHF